MEPTDADLAKAGCSWADVMTIHGPPPEDGDPSTAYYWFVVRYSLRKPWRSVGALEGLFMAQGKAWNHRIPVMVPTQEPPPVEEMERLFRESVRLLEED